MGILYADNVEVSVSNTSSYTQIFHYNLPANTLINGSMFRLGVRGLCLNGTGVVRSLDVRMEVSDGTSTATITADGMEVFSGNRESVVDAEFLSISTALQKAMLYFQQASYDAGSNDENVLFNGTLSGAVDTTKSLSVRILLKPSLASANLTFIKHWAFLELV